MDKKPLIGISICAVVLLVLGSLSNVVGYQSMKSTVNDSPLFTTRTQRATNQQQTILTSQYLGLGKKNLLQFPSKNNKTEILNKFIKIIRSMNQKSFEQSMKLYLDNIRKENICDTQTLNKILLILYEIKKTPDTIIKYFFTENKDEHLSDRTIHLTPFGCILDAMFILFMYVIDFVTYVFNIIKYGPTNYLTCYSVSCCGP